LPVQRFLTVGDRWPGLPINPG